MADATAAVICGSLPAGLPAETYATLATYAAEAGVPVVLAPGGDELRHCIPWRPALVTPDLAGAVAPIRRTRHPKTTSRPSTRPL